MNIELEIFTFLNGLTGKSFFLDSFFYFFAQIIPVLIVASLFFWVIIKRREGLWLAGGAIFSGLFTRYTLVELIRNLFPRSRPFHILEEIDLLLPYKESLSFPSGHIAFLFALSTVVYMKNGIAGTVFYTLAFLAGVARVVAGMHWPLDILCAMFLGVVAGILLEIFLRWFRETMEKNV